MVSEEHFLFLTGRLSVFAELSAEFCSDLRGCVVEKTYDRNQFVLSEGHQQVYLWFIVSGFAREVSASDIPPFNPTSWFWFSGDLIFQNGFFSNQKSLVAVEVYRGSVVLEISDRNLQLLSSRHPEVHLLSEAFRFADYKKRKQHTSDLAMLKRLDHMRLVFQEHKLLFNTALHRDLASFFGIKSQNLTRYLKDLY
jgi:CRP-like cAMP-binding protein